MGAIRSTSSNKHSTSNTLATTTSYKLLQEQHHASLRFQERSCAGTSASTSPTAQERPLRLKTPQHHCPARPRDISKALIWSLSPTIKLASGTAAARPLHPQLLHRAAQTSSLMAEEVACSIVTMRIHRLEMPGSE